LLFSPTVSPKHGEEKNIDDHVNSCDYDDTYSHTKKRSRKCSLPINILSTKDKIKLNQRSNSTPCENEVFAAFRNGDLEAPNKECILKMMKKISKKVYETQTIKLFGEKPDKRAIKTGFS